MTTTPFLPSTPVSKVNSYELLKCSTVEDSDMAKESAANPTKEEDPAFANPAEENSKKRNSPHCIEPHETKKASIEGIKKVEESEMNPAIMLDKIQTTEEALDSSAPVSFASLIQDENLTLPNPCEANDDSVEEGIGKIACILDGESVKLVDEIAG
jgi:hypothetical protein